MICQPVDTRLTRTSSSFCGKQASNGIKKIVGTISTALGGLDLLPRIDAMNSNYFTRILKAIPPEKYNSPEVDSEGDRE